jgi:hypothetical protein
MESYSHAFFSWALAKHGLKAGRPAGIAAAVGAVLPDVPAVVATAYYVGPRFLSEGWAAMHAESVIEDIYFTGPFGAAGTALHSAVPVAGLLILYRLLNLDRRDARRILLWLLLGWLGHTVADLLTHVEDTRPLLWPVFGWEWSSPVSYWNPEHYGREFFFVQHSLMILIAVRLLVKRLLWRKEAAPSAEG